MSGRLMEAISLPLPTLTGTETGLRVLGNTADSGHPLNPNHSRPRVFCCGVAPSESLFSKRQDEGGRTEVEEEETLRRGLGRYFGSLY